MRGLRTSVLTLGSLVTLAAPCTAQRPASEFLSVMTVTVKPSAVTDYEDFVKKVLAAATKTNASPSVVFTFQATAGPSYTYLVASPFNSWADRDKWMLTGQILAKAYGDVEGARIHKAGRAAIERIETAVYRLSPASSAKTLTYPLAKYGLMVRTQVRPDMALEYNEYLEKLRDAESKTGAPGRIRRVAVEGPSTVFISTTLYQSQAERDKWTSPLDTLIKAYGEAEGRRLSDQSNKTVVSREIISLVTRPDLSLMPPTS